MRVDFGDFELDLARHELRRAGAPVDLASKPLDLLVYLARHRDRTVSRAELLREVWPEGGVSEAALSTALRDLRRALGDNGRSQELIRTLRGRGIRFVAAAQVSARAPSAARSDFVGRAEPLARLEAGLDASAAGHRSSFLLTGEAGVGKTRLARELAERAAARGFRSPLGRAWDGEGAPPFFPWTTMLREALGETSPGRLRERLGPRTPWIAPLLPELVPEEPTPTGSETRFRVYAAVDALLRSLADAAPLVLVFDDVQQADLGSLELLRFLAFEETPARLLLVATWRDGEPAEEDPRTRILRTLTRGERVEVLALEGLGREETASLVGPIAGHAPDEAFLSALHDQTRGNPFFATEAVRHLRGSLPPGRRGGRWTEGFSIEAAGLADGIRRMLERRLEAPGIDCRPVLEAAAVVGGEANVELLERVGSLSGEPVPALLDRAVAAQLMEEVPVRRGRLRFSHPLIREALYDGLGLARRRALHREVGEALEATSRNDPDPPWAALALHFDEAGPPALAKALTFTERAARTATSRHAWADAARLFARTLELQQRAGSPDPKARCELLIELCRAERFSLQPLAAEAAGSRAIELARTLGSPELFTRAVLGHHEAIRDRETTIPIERLPLLEEALSALGETDPALLASALARWSWDATFSDGVDPKPRSLEALALARRSDESDALALCLDACANAHWEREHTELRARLIDEMSQLPTASAELASHVSAHAFSERIRAGDPVGAEAALRACASVLEADPAPVVVRHHQLHRGQFDLLQGRIADAEKVALRILDEAESIGSLNLIRMGVTLLIACFWFTGRLGELLGALVDQPIFPVPEEVAALIEALGGREGRARERFRRLAATGFERDPTQFSPSQEGMRLFALVQVCQQLEAAEAVPVLEKRLRPILPDHICVNACRYCGSSLHWMGILAATAGRHDEALSLFDRALDAYRALEAEPFLAKVDWARAHSLERCGSPDAGRAASLRRDAAAAAERLGIAL